MSSNSNQIVVVGSCMIDFVSYCPRIPKPGETIHGTKFVTNFGGKGANQCVAASRLGGQTAMVARVGDDLWGTKYIDNFKTEKVDTTFVKITPNMSSGIAQINVADSGDNQIIIVAGANNSLNIEDVEEAHNVITSAAVVVTQLETSVDVALRAIQLCRGISILNGAPGLSKYDQSLLRLPTIFCVNETEASLFSGLSVNDEREAEIAAFNLLAKGCNSVLITLGPKGALYVSNGDKKVIHVLTPQVDCVDSTGAGDAFIGWKSQIPKHYLIAIIYVFVRPLDNELDNMFSDFFVTGKSANTSYCVQPEVSMPSSVQSLDQQSCAL